MDLSEASNPPYRQAPAVTRTVRVLRKLGEADAPMGARELARALDLVPSTCLHILRALTAEGLVEFDPSAKRYSLGVGILAIARAAIQQSGFATLTQPMLAQLSRQFGVTAMATELFPVRQMIVVAIAQAPQAFRLAADLGSRFPELVSATGRCVVAFNEPDQASLRVRFDELAWDDPPTFETWLAEIDRTRKEGYGVDRANFLNGLTIVAVPVFDAEGRMTRGLVTVGITETVDAVGAANIAAALLQARDELAACFFPESG
jgi:DNA-binding IclR family transcriptional regulator